MRLEKMKAPVSGNYIPRRHAVRVYGTVRGYGLPDAFADGLMFALGFLTCPEDADMHGASVEEFLENYLRNLTADELPDEVKTKAAEVIDQLERMGVEVVGVSVMRSHE